MNADPLRDIAQRDSVEPVFREQVLGRVENLFQAFSALLRLAAPLALGSFRHLPSPLSTAQFETAKLVKYRLHVH